MAMLLRNWLPGLVCALAALGPGATAIRADGPPGIEPLGTAGPTAVLGRYVFDVGEHSPDEVDALLRRAEEIAAGRAAAGDARIAFVLHGRDLELFANRNRERHRTLVDRAERLDRDGVIDFKACRITARELGITPDGLPPFIELVPNGPLEVERLRAEGYIDL